MATLSANTTGAAQSQAIWVSSPQTTIGGGSITTWPNAKPETETIKFQIARECKEKDPDMYYLLLAYLHKHIQEFEAIVKTDKEFEHYRIKAKPTEYMGNYTFTMYYEKDVTKG